MIYLTFGAFIGLFLSIALFFIIFHGKNKLSDAIKQEFRNTFLEDCMQVFEDDEEQSFVRFFGAFMGLFGIFLVLSFLTVFVGAFIGLPIFILAIISLPFYFSYKNSKNKTKNE